MGARVGAIAKMPAPFFTIDAVASAVKFAAENVLSAATSTVTFEEAGIARAMFAPKAQLSVMFSVPPDQV